MSNNARANYLSGNSRARGFLKEHSVELKRIGELCYPQVSAMAFPRFCDGGNAAEREFCRGRFLTRVKEHGWDLLEAVEALWRGERDHDVLCNDLDANSAEVVRAALLECCKHDGEKGDVSSRTVIRKHAVALKRIAELSDPVVAAACRPRFCDGGQEQEKTECLSVILAPVEKPVEKGGMGFSGLCAAVSAMWAGERDLAKLMAAAGPAPAPAAALAAGGAVGGGATEIGDMSVKQLKYELSKNGASTAGMTEVSELIAALQAREQAGLWSAATAEKQAAAAAEAALAGHAGTRDVLQHILAMTPAAGGGAAASAAMMIKEHAVSFKRIAQLCDDALAQATLPRFCPGGTEVEKAKVSTELLAKISEEPVFGGSLVGPVRRIWAGERDAVALCAELTAESPAPHIVRDILRQIAALPDVETARRSAPGFDNAQRWCRAHSSFIERVATLSVSSTSAQRRAMEDELEAEIDGYEEGGWEISGPIRKLFRGERRDAELVSNPAVDPNSQVIVRELLQKVLLKDASGHRMDGGSASSSSSAAANQSQGNQGGAKQGLVEIRVRDGRQYRIGDTHSFKQPFSISGRITAVKALEPPRPTAPHAATVTVDPNTGPDAAAAAGSKNPRGARAGEDAAPAPTAPAPPPPQAQSGGGAPDAPPNMNAAEAGLWAVIGQDPRVRQMRAESPLAFDAAFRQATDETDMNAGDIESIRRRVEREGAPEVPDELFDAAWQAASGDTQGARVTAERVANMGRARRGETTGDSRIVVGSRVRVARAVREPTFGWGNLINHENAAQSSMEGRVNEIDEGRVYRVSFPAIDESFVWNCLGHELELVEPIVERTPTDELQSSTESQATLRPPEAKDALRRASGMLRAGDFDGAIESCRKGLDCSAEDIELQSLLTKAMRAAVEARAEAGVRDDADGEGDGALPAEFFCPITRDVMTEPVLAEDGFSYQKDAIEQWLGRPGSQRSPHTNLPMGPTTTLNRALKAMIADRLSTSPARGKAAAVEAEQPTPTQNKLTSEGRSSELSQLSSSSTISSNATASEGRMTPRLDAADISALAPDQDPLQPDDADADADAGVDLSGVSWDAFLAAASLATYSAQFDAEGLDDVEDLVEVDADFAAEIGLKLFERERLLRLGASRAAILELMASCDDVGGASDEASAVETRAWLESNGLQKFSAALVEANGLRLCDVRADGAVGAITNEQLAAGGVDKSIKRSRFLRCAKELCLAEKDS